MPWSFFGPDKVADLLDDPLGADAVGQLGDDDALAAGGDVLDRVVARVRKVPRPVSYASRIPSSPTIRPPVGRSGPGTNRIRSSSVGVRVAIRCRAAAMTSPRLCGGHVGRHADRDAGGAVDEQVREGRGQDRGLLLLAVVVRPEVDDVLVDAVDHQHRGGVSRHSV